MKIMRRMKLNKIKCEVSSSPDIDSLIGMLKPIVKAGKWRSDVEEMVSFIRGASCQMHSTIHSIPLSQFWHLFHLLKGLVAYQRVELIVVSKDTPVEVIVDVCHVTKVVVHTMGDPTVIEQAECADLCGAVSANLLTQLSLATLQSARFYDDHAGVIAGAIHYKPLDNVFSVQGPCEGFHTMCLMENDIPIDLGETCCKSYISSDLCPAVCPVSESLLMWF